jgi:Zn-dependent M28 family amino/carboxypeptidase
MGCLGGVLLLAIGLVVLAWLMVNPVKPQPNDVGVTVEADKLRLHVGSLTRLGGYRSFEYPAVLDRAAEYIRDEWAAMGFEVEEQPYEVMGTTYRNVLTGYGPSDGPLVVVGAHYDVCGDQDGADDNGSAVASLLELSRLLATERPPLARRIELVAFTLEEPPFFRTDGMGSAVHVQSLRQRGAPVKAMISLEMLGYFSDAPRSQSFPAPGFGLLYPRTGSFIAVVGNLAGRRLTREVKSRMAGACAVPVHSINAPSIVPGVDFSDHLNYWRAGIPAVMITDTAFYRNPNYHQPSDTAETLDYDRAAEVVKGLYAAVVALAS